MTKKSRLPAIMVLKKVFVLFTISLFTFSCASLGSKTLYLDKYVTIKTPTKILLVRPTMVNCIGGQDENFNCIEKLISLELAPYNISVKKSNIDYQDFDKIGQVSTFAGGNISNGDFLMFSKITRLTAMGQTRDYKVEYKLVSIFDKKLKFHSKYNTTVGATMIVIPGIKDFPNTDQLMAIAIKSGLYEFKKKLLTK